MRTITLNDGTVLEGTLLEGGYDDYILIYIDGMPISQGFAIFSDASKTNRIVYNNYDKVIEYNGFTGLDAINNEFGNCNVMLRKVI